MRDLIDRDELVKWMERFIAKLRESEDISASYVNGYRAAMRDVHLAKRVNLETAKGGAE